MDWYSISTWEEKVTTWEESTSFLSRSRALTPTLPPFTPTPLAHSLTTLSTSSASEWDKMASTWKEVPVNSYFYTLTGLPLLRSTIPTSLRSLTVSNPAADNLLMCVTASGREDKDRVLCIMLSNHAYFDLWTFVNKTPPIVCLTFDLLVVGVTVRPRGTMAQGGLKTKFSAVPPPKSKASKGKKKKPLGPRKGGKCSNNPQDLKSSG